MKQRNRLNQIVSLITLMILVLALLAFATAETTPEEEGLLEIQPLLAAAQVENMEGLDLEQLTEELAGEAMSEYMDSESGFRMQYPSAFTFSEEGGAAFASGEDGRIHMMIESMPRGEGLSEEMIQQAIMLDSPDAKIQRYEESSCLRFDRRQDDGALMIDLYVLTQTRIHHVSISCADSAEETLLTWLEYMIHSITTNETDVG